MDSKNITMSMLKTILIIVVIISCIFFGMSLLKIEKEEEPKEKKIIHQEIIKKIEEISPIKIDTITEILEPPIGRIKIEKLNMNKPLYKIESNKNNVEENITILNGSTYPDIEQSTLFIAAHSGEGRIAYFKDLDQLKENDDIKIEYQGKEYIYQVTDIYEQPKNGYINGRIEKKRQLILTTCCPKKDNCQLIINCIEKES